MYSLFKTYIFWKMFDFMFVIKKRTENKTKYKL